MTKDTAKITKLLDRLRAAQFQLDSTTTSRNFAKEKFWEQTEVLDRLEDLVTEHQIILNVRQDKLDLELAK